MGIDIMKKLYINTRLGAMYVIAHDVNGKPIESSVELRLNQYCVNNHPCSTNLIPIDGIETSVSNFEELFTGDCEPFLPYDVSPNRYSF